MEGLLSLLPDDVQRLRDATLSLLRAYVVDVELAIEYHQNGRTQVDLATRHGVSQQTISNRIHRVHRKLREVGLMPAEWERQATPC